MPAKDFIQLNKPNSDLAEEGNPELLALHKFSTNQVLRIVIADVGCMDDRREHRDFRFRNGDPDVRACWKDGRYDADSLTTYVAR